MTQFELAVQDPQGLRVAKAVGADRMELVEALSTGGVTPSAGFIEVAVATGVPVHALVRPREGSFEYDADEKRTILADVRHAVALGAAGVVIGGLVGGLVDLDLVRSVRETAGAAEVTFHRAFDQLADRESAVDQLADAGVTRVLTSGGKAAAGDALDTLRALVSRSSGRVQVMAGGGVTSATAAAVAATGVDAVHASAKRAVTEQLAVSLGSGAAAGDSVRFTNDVDEARAVLAALGR